MAKRKTDIPPPVYNYWPIQVKKMKDEFPQFRSYVENGRFFFVGMVQPALDMPQYKIRIEYRKDLMPRVRVLEPQLIKNPPHFYQSTQSLCLFKPENLYWEASTLISDYIVGWATAWLYFYEYWLQDRIWYGPEAHHDKNTPKKYT